MKSLFRWGILSVLLVAHTAREAFADRLPPGGVIYDCQFDEDDDVNFDGWPDGWTRRRGPGFPQYLKVGIEPRYEDVARGNRWLRLELDGGAAQIGSPSIEVSTKFDYAVEGRFRAKGLTDSATHVTLTFMDAKNKPLQVFATPLVRSVDEWTTFRIGPITCKRTAAVRAVVNLHLGPADANHAGDLTGSAEYDDLRIYRLPQLRVTTSSPCNVVTMEETLRIDGGITTLDDRPVEVRLTLFDMEEQPVDNRVEKVRDDFSWEPKFPREGYYRVHLVMHAGEGLDIHRDVPIAVVRSGDRVFPGEFGWSLDRDSQPLEPRELPLLLKQAGIRWVKLPLWQEADDPELVLSMGRLVEELRASGITTVGVLDLPPAVTLKKLRGASHISVAEIFTADDLWRPALDTVLTRMSLQLRWWQLGADGDHSFLGVRNMEQRWREIQRHAAQYGTNIRFGTPWPWPLESPRGAGESLSFLSLESKPSFTAKELDAYLGARRKTSQNGTARSWVTIEPLPRSRFDVERRARDLVTRMLAAKRHGADAIFATRVFDSEYGLMHPNGTPAELFLPWRTTSRLIGKSEYLGSIQLPNGSENQVFQRGDDTVMVVWNQRPTRERLYLGENVRVVDVWDRESQPSVHTDHDRVQQEIETGPMPRFVIGCNPVVARWRIHFALETLKLDAFWGQSQSVRYRFRNADSSAADGVVEAKLPASWKTSSPRSRLRLDVDQQGEVAIEVKLGTETVTGYHRLRFDFDVTTDELYKFDVYDTLVVGHGDVEVKLAAQFDELGRLVVDQELINHTDESLRFGCMLFIPERGRQWRSASQEGRGRSTQRYVIPNGQELIGKTLILRAEELGGGRLLNAELLIETP